MEMGLPSRTLPKTFSKTNTLCKQSTQLFNPNTRRGIWKLVKANGWPKQRWEGWLVGWLEKLNCLDIGGRFEAKQIWSREKGNRKEKRLGKDYSLFWCGKGLFSSSV